MTSPIDTASVAIVPDFSAFGREASAGIDRALRGVVGDVRTAFGTVERAAADAGADVGREFQQGGESAERAFREISTTARREFAQVQTSAAAAGSGMRTNLGGALGFVKTALAGVAVAGAAGLAALTGFGLKSAAELEQVQVAFNSLLGSAEKGTEVFKGLQQFAAATPFEFPEVAGAAQRFLAFNDAVGLSDAQLQPFLTTLGNVASVTGGGAQALNSVTLAMGQIASSGKLTLDNLNQISEALPGFSGVAAIAAATGKTTAQVMEEISAGEISATAGIQALLAGMAKFPGAAGAMEKQSQTLLGVFSTFKDTLTQALVGGFAPVLPEIKASLGQLTPVLGEALGQLAPSLGKLLSGLLPLIGSLVEGIVPILAPILDALGPALQALGPTLAPLGEALGEILTALAPILPLAGEFLAVLVQVAIPILQLLALVLKPLTPVLQFMADAVGELGKALDMIDWGAVGESISSGFGDALDAIGSFFAGIGDWFAGIGEWFSKLPTMIGERLAAMPGVIVEVTKRAFDMFFTAVGFGIGTIIKFFVDLPGQIGALISLLWTTVVSLTMAGIATTVQFFRDLPGIIGGLVSDLWTRVKEFFTTGVANAVALVKSLPGKLLAALSGLKDQLFNLGRNMITGLIDGIKAMIGRAIDTVKRAMGDIVNGAKKALGIASPSKVFADAVGAEIPAGIAEGIQAGVPSLSRLLGDITAPTTVNATAGGAGATFGPGSVVVQFTGAVPTTAEARRVGQTVGASIAATLQRRNIATAVRSL